MARINFFLEALELRFCRLIIACAIAKWRVFCPHCNSSRAVQAFFGPWGLLTGSSPRQRGELEKSGPTSVRESGVVEARSPQAGVGRACLKKKKKCSSLWNRFWVPRIMKPAFTHLCCHCIWGARHFLWVRSGGIAFRLLPSLSALWLRTLDFGL